MDICIFCDKPMLRLTHPGVPDSEIAFECEECSFGAVLGDAGFVEEWDLKSANLIGWYKAESPLSTISG